jgi:hypothetical protein
MTAIIAFLLATAFPSSSRTSWMRPEAFHLAIGMSRADTMKRLEDGGWKTTPGKDASQVIVDYSDVRSMTLGFERERLKSIRFELFEILPKIHSAFDEEKAWLKTKLGAPKKLKSKSIVLYENTLPNVMVVVSADPKSEQGKKGVGMLVVRYFDPVQVKKQESGR